MASREKPVLIFDGRCGFCRIWIDYWRKLTGDALEYAESQDVQAEFPQIPHDDFRRSVQLVLPDGDVYQGSEAVFRSLELGGSTLGINLYRKVPLFGRVSEAAYRFIARNRNLAYWVTVTLLGRTVASLSYGRVEWLFIKALSLIWIFAFVSFGSQALGLIGSTGVLPVGAYLGRAHEYLGTKAYAVLPTVLWINSSDTVIQTLWIAGAVCGLLALVGVARRAAMLGAWILYLSLFHAAQDFLGFQWDLLLLESGFLALFLGYSRAIVWMFRWLLFRLVFLSGAVKLMSGDPTWSSLGALSVHYQTQPIPTPLAWYAHQLPGSFQRFSTGMVLFLELTIPIFVLGPRRIRMLAAPWMIGLQVLILLTGNYAFFNWLTLALCLFLFDDAFFSRWSMPKEVVAGFRRQRLAWTISAALFLLSTLALWQNFTGRLSGIANRLLSSAAPLALVNNYGLFATMTTIRAEIVLEGSNDGAQWQEYEFRYKPGSVSRPLPWVAPHQPRLDWQMWFAALSTYRENGWFVNLVFRLLQGNPKVVALLAHDPFAPKPPVYIRAQVYEYRFTSWGSQDWWTRRLMGPYLPAVSLQSFETTNQAR